MGPAGMLSQSWPDLLRGGRRSVRLRGVPGAFQLHLEPLGADLEAVHTLYGSLRAVRVVVRHEPWKQSATDDPSSSSSTDGQSTGENGQQVKTHNQNLVTNMLFQPASRALCYATLMTARPVTDQG